MVPTRLGTAAALLCLLSSACTAGESSPVSASASRVLVDVPTNGHRPGDPSFAALTEGELAVVRRGSAAPCFVLRQQGQTKDVVWPYGFHADFSRQPAELLGLDGSVVAREGEMLSMGGGYSFRRMGCSGNPAWSVGSIEVAGEQRYGGRGGPTYGAERPDRGLVSGTFTAAPGSAPWTPHNLDRGVVQFTSGKEGHAGRIERDWSYEADVPPGVWRVSVAMSDGRTCSVPIAVILQEGERVTRDVICKLLPAPRKR